MTKPKPNVATASLVGHHFQSAEPDASVRDLVCAGCGKTVLALFDQALRLPGGTSTCPTPHDEAERGQVMRVPERLLRR